MLEVALTQYNYYTDYHYSNSQLLIPIPILATTSIVHCSLSVYPPTEVRWAVM